MLYPFVLSEMSFMGGFDEAWLAVADVRKEEPVWPGVGYRPGLAMLFNGLRHFLH
jgi:hypothetical protein